MANARRRYARLIVGDRDVSGLDFSFSVDRTLELTPNSAEISIFNLSEANRKVIAGEGIGVPVLLEAGYQDLSGTIFEGVLRRVESFRSGPVDWETHLSGGDGEEEIQTARTSATFPPGSTLVQAITKLATDLGAGPGNLPQAIALYGLSKFTRSFPRGITLTGSAADELSELLRSVGLSFSIQNGELLIVESGVPASLSAISLTSETGLIGSPSVDADGELAAMALLNPAVIPGALVSVVSSAVVGAFVVEAVTYHGSMRTSEWYVDIQGKELVSV